MTPHQRGRLGGLARSAMYDGREMTAKARQAARDRFLEQVDPTGELRRKRVSSHCALITATTTATTTATPAAISSLTSK